jgi:hypothetical protein
MRPGDNNKQIYCATSKEDGDAFRVLLDETLQFQKNKV